MFRLQPAGFTNADLRTITADLRGIPSDQVTTGQMTYDLRRLQTHGLIVRIKNTHRYRVTDHGLHTAVFLSRIHDRLLPTGLADLTDPHPNRPLRAASIAYQKAIDNLTNATGLVAQPPDKRPNRPKLTLNSGSADPSHLEAHRRWWCRRRRVTWEGLRSRRFSGKRWARERGRRAGGSFRYRPG